MLTTESKRTPHPTLSPRRGEGACRAVRGILHVPIFDRLYNGNNAENEDERGRPGGHVSAQRESQYSGRRTERRHSRPRGGAADDSLPARPDASSPTRLEGQSRAGTEPGG